MGVTLAEPPREELWEAVGVSDAEGTALGVPKEEGVEESVPLK